jgi:hypothetical protein
VVPVARTRFSPCTVSAAPPARSTRSCRSRAAQAASRGERYHRSGTGTISGCWTRRSW